MSAPKSDTATIAARQNRLLSLLAEGKTQGEAAEVLRDENYPADLRTVQRDVRSLRGQWGEQNMSQFEIWRDEHIAELQELREKLQDESIRPAERIALALKIIDQDSKLKGTAAPTKHITAHVDGEKITQGFYAEFARRTIRKFKHPESWQRLWDWIEAQPSDYEHEDRLLLEANNENV
jgi:hypothetical protein